MEYRLTQIQSKARDFRGLTQWRELISLTKPLLNGEWTKLGVIFIAVLINIGSSVLTPYLLSRAIDGPILTRDIQALTRISLALVGIYVLAAAAAYVQARLMGRLSQRVLFRLRKRIFDQIQSLPVAFFHQNSTGDLISRINNDTDKINQFLSEGILRFISLFFSLVGIAIMMLYLNWIMGSLILAITMILLGITYGVGPWLEKLNKDSLTIQGELSGEVQENFSHFEVLIAFRRQDFFRKTFEQLNQQGFKAKLWAQISSNIIAPLYTLVSNMSQAGIITLGIYLIMQGQLTIGLLIGFLTYTQKFFEPLRILGSILGRMQEALAAWSRLRDILVLSSDLPQISDIMVGDPQTKEALVFDRVNFTYPQGKHVLREVSFIMERGKTYALVGPTGGGKSTTALLMARLYDPTGGSVRLFDRDIKTYSNKERTQKIGFILQDPFLFTGTVKDNLVYGNKQLEHLTTKQLDVLLASKGLTDLLLSFPQSLDTEVNTDSTNISLGQRQLIAFIRAILREPEILILDEATANIDTVTENNLSRIIEKLAPSTTKIIIAHRLNTIRSADQIFFVGGGEIIPAGDVDQAISLIQKQS